MTQADPNPLTPTPGPAPKPTGSLASQTVAGTAWAVIAVVIGQVAALATQYVAGLQLEPADFRVIGLAMAIAGFASAVRTAGIRHILIQRGDEYAQLCRPAMHTGLVSAVVMGLIIFVVSSWIETALGAEGLQTLLWIVALSMVPGVPGRVYGAKLGIDLRFKASQMVIAAMQLVRQCSAIVLLLLWPGPMALILPMLISEVFEWIASRWVAGPMPKAPRPAQWADYREIYQASKWIILSVIGTVLVENLDNVVIDAVQGGVILGFYFFAYRLTIGLYSIISNGMLNVFMPSLAKLVKEGSERQLAAYERSARSLVLLSGLMCGLLAVLGGPLVQAVWQGKWNDAAPLVVIMAMSLITRMLMPLAVSLLSANGAWRLRSAVLLGDGLLVGVAAWLGAWLGDTGDMLTTMINLTIVISIYRTIAGMIGYWVAGRLIGLPVVRVLQTITLPAAAYLLLTLGSLWAQHAITGWSGAALASVALVVGWLIAARLLQRAVFVDLLRVFGRVFLGPLRRLRGA